MGAPGYGNGFEVTMHNNRLQEPLTRKTPTRYFVNSMSDLFHDRVSDIFIKEVFDVMRRANWHEFQVLTKRPERLLQTAEMILFPKNVWLGVSVENKRQGLPRIDQLRSINSAIRFLSIEPLLEDLGEIDLSKIDWVIVGGESGVKSRPLKAEWVRSIRDRCVALGIPFFFKQWGSIGEDGVRRSKAKNGCSIDGLEWRQFPRVIDG